MARFVVNRLVGMAFVLFAVSVLVFVVFALIPNGDPAQRMAGRSATPELVAEIEREWGFDRSLPVQYLTMMGNVLGGELVSYRTGEDVDERIVDGLPVTVSLVAGAAVLWLVVGVGLGYLGGTRRGSRGDRAAGVLALVGLSLPVFWVGGLLLYLLSAESDVFPPGGYVALGEDPLGWAHHLALPWLSLAIVLAGVYFRLVRSRMLEVAGEDHVRTARAKGLSEGRIWTRHVLRGALAPVVAVFALDVGAAFAGGSIIVESVFGLNGVGQYAADAITTLDPPAIMAVTLFGAFFVVVLSAAADIAYAYLDPRVRASAEASARRVRRSWLRARLGRG